MHLQTPGWHDGSTLLEKQEWDLLHCRLTPVPTGQASTCPISGTIGRAAAAVGGTGNGAFFLSGSTDGTPGGTDAHTYIDDDVNYEAPLPGSAFRFVQRDAQDQVVRDDGFAVNDEHSAHSHDDDGPGEAGSRRTGVFGTEFEAMPAAVGARDLEGGSGGARLDPPAPPRAGRRAGVPGGGAAGPVGGDLGHRRQAAGPAPRRLPGV
jgi:hypothetical protein